MIDKTTINYIKYLYQNIFDEDTKDSKEFTIFVKEKNPHPLRIKIEEYNQKLYENVLNDYKNRHNNINPNFRNENKLDYILELDAIITNYIEENIDNGK